MKTQKVILADCIKEMQKLAAESVDILLTDPPYKYLKNQKLEIDFDEIEFFNQANRVLKNGGFLIFFGRGKSFHRWNYIVGEMLDEKGKDVFEFKESMSWDKGYSSSPLLAISRTSEDFIIWAKGKNKINKSKVHDIDRVIQDVNRLKSVFKNTKSLDAVLNYLENNIDKKETIIRDDYEYSDNFTKHKATSSENKGSGNRCVNVINSINSGMNEKSIVRVYENEYNGKHYIACAEGIKTNDRNKSTLISICEGMREKTILKQGRDHYATIHPTQKPVELLKRILNLVVKSKNDVVVDPFAGSCSTGVACKELSLEFVGYEIDKEYFDSGKKRLEEHKI